MIVAAGVLIVIVAALHVYFLILEMFLWTKPAGMRAFRLTPERARDTAAMAANQGLYNGFLAAGLIWGLLHPSIEVGKQIDIFFLLCVIVAGLYGGYSVSKRIVVVQAVPAVIALAVLLMAK